MIIFNKNIIKRLLISPFMFIFGIFDSLVLLFILPLFSFVGFSQMFIEVFKIIGGDKIKDTELKLTFGLFILPLYIFIHPFVLTGTYIKTGKIERSGNGVSETIIPI